MHLNNKAMLAADIGKVRKDSLCFGLTKVIEDKVS